MSDLIRYEDVEAKILNIQGQLAPELFPFWN